MAASNNTFTEHYSGWRLRMTKDTIVQTIFGGGNGGRVGNCVNRSDSISTVSIFATDVVVSTGRVGIVEQE